MDSSFHQLDDAKARALHLLTCPLCSTQYQDPRVLPCQHTFCCRCLLAHVDAVQAAAAAPASRSTRLGAFACPQCHADVGLPAAGPSAFPVDQRIRNIRDLFVDEMAKDLASRIKDRRKDGGGGGVCNGEGRLSDDVLHGHHRHHAAGGVSAASTRLSDINERPSVDDDDDDVDFGTWPRRSGNESTASHVRATASAAASDEPVFSRHSRGYSSVRGTVGSRRTRLHDTPPSKNHEESSTFSDSSGAATPPDCTDPHARFSRTGPGYFSMRVPRSRRSRGEFPDVDAATLPEGRTPTSSASFANGHSSSQSRDAERQKYERSSSSSHADVQSKSSPFDHINRDDDTADTYTPIIGRHRSQYSSLRERRRRPHFDPNQLYDNPSDFTTTDEDLSGSDGSGRFSAVDRGGRHPAAVGVPSSSGFDGNLRRTVSSDLNWTWHSSGHHEPQRLARRNRDYGSDQWHTAGENGTSEQRRQRADSFDTSVLTGLSNLPADVLTRITNSNVSDWSATTSTGDHRQAHVDQPSADAVHRTSPPDSAMTSSTAEEVSSASHTENDVASQINERRCQGDLMDKTADEVADSKQTDLANSSFSECLPSASTAENADAVRPSDIPIVNRQCSVSEEGISSPPRSPANESCFSRLTKFRSSKNSRHQTASSASPSAADTTSKESQSPSPGDAEASATVPASKSRVRKRPSAFVGTAFSFPVSSSTGENVATSTPPPVVRNDEVDAESASSDREQTQQFERCRAASGNGSADVTSLDADDVKAGQTVTDVGDRQTSDVSPDSASEMLPSPSVESDDVVQSRVDDVSASQSTTAAGAQRHDEDDSAVYSVDTDASLTSAVEQPTPSTDDDDADDGVLVTKADESRSTRLDGQTDDIRTGLGDDDGLTMSESLTETDVSVEHRQGDVLLTNANKDRSTIVENAVPKDCDRGERSSSARSSPAEQGPPTDDDDRVNEDDVTSSDRKEADVGENGRSSIEAVDDLTDGGGGGCVLATGLAALSDAALVVADYGARCVRLCDDQGRTEHRVTGLKPFSVTTSLAGDHDGLIYVGDRRRKTLVVLDRHGADVAQWPDNQFDWICGIACLADGQLAVLDRSRTRQLGIYPASGDDGRALAELGGQGTSLGDLCMAEFIAADSLGRVLVADSGNHCVKAFDPRVPRPGVVAVYGTTRGSGDAQLEWPKGVSVDSADNVLVADCRNGRVVSFGVDGRSLGSVVPAVRGPFAVCTLPTSLSSRRRRLAVTTHSIGAVSQFRFYDYDTEAIFV